MTRSTPHPTSPDHPILLFGGVCNLCNGVTRFVIRNVPPPGKFHFAALQSERGQQLLREYGLPAEALDTLVMIEGPRTYLRSSAALRVLRGLGLPWSILYVLTLVPRPFRDAVYDWVARHRPGWFGRQEAREAPRNDIQSRFLSWEVQA